MSIRSFYLPFFFFNDTATTEIYTLSLHDALPISARPATACSWSFHVRPRSRLRSEEHTSELQSRENVVCRLLLEKKKIKIFWNLFFLKKKETLYTYMKKGID